MSRLFTAAVVLIVAVSTTARAQLRRTPPVNDGPMLELGLGLGMASRTCKEGCPTGFDSGAHQSLSGFARVGGAARQDLVLYIGLNRWSKADDSTTVSVVALGAEWFPVPQTFKGFYVNGALGIGIVNTPVLFFGKTEGESGTGLGFEGGLGYDYAVTRNVTVGGFAAYFGTTTVKFQDAAARERANVFHIGLSLGAH